MTPPQDFFGAVKPWSRHKHDILSKYLHVWVSKLQFRRSLLVYVDACAGAGSYASGEDGSPVIAARWNDHGLLAESGKRLLVIAIEQDADLFPDLEASLSPWAKRVPPQATALRGAFEDHIGKLVEITRGIPSFFFVDPFGVHGIEPDQLKPLLSAQNLHRTEILLRVDPGIFARASGWLRRKRRSAREQKTAESFERLLRRLEISDEVLDALSAEDDGLVKGERAAWLLSEYAKLFEGVFRYVQLIPIRASYFRAPKYFLLHATNSPDGASKLNDVVSTTEDRMFVETMKKRESQARQPSLFASTAEDRSQSYDGTPRWTIEDAARSAQGILTRERGSLRMIELSAELALEFGPDLRFKHHKQAVRRLAERGVLAWDGATLGEKSIVRLL